MILKMARSLYNFKYAFIYLYSIILTDIHEIVINLGMFPHTINFSLQVPNDFLTYLRRGVTHLLHQLHYVIGPCVVIMMTMGNKDSLSLLKVRITVILHWKVSQNIFTFWINFTTLSVQASIMERSEPVPTTKTLVPQR